MTRRRVTVATLPWLALVAVLTPRATNAARRHFWRGLSDPSPSTTHTTKEH